MELQTETKESTFVGVRFERGVLVASITAESLLDQLAICEIEQRILQEIPKTDQAVLVDCSSLTRPVSSQFLSTLVRIHNHAKDAELPTAVCCLSPALRSAYDVTTLTSIIPAYEDQADAIHDLGRLDNDRVQGAESVSGFISRYSDLSAEAAALAGVDRVPQPEVTELVNVRLVKRVLVAEVLVNSLIHERPICDVEDRILGQLESSHSAVLIDCSELTDQVSSQFLSMLMRVYYAAKELGLKVAACGLSEPLREAYRVTALASLVPSYEHCEEALAELRESGHPADKKADAAFQPSSDLGSSAPGPLSWFAQHDNSSTILLMLGAVVLVGLGFLAGISLNRLESRSGSPQGSPTIEIESSR